MDNQELKKRTKHFALRVIKLCDALSQKGSSVVIDRQLIRSATSVAANYRSACRGRSKSEFIAKIGICLEDIDESSFWMELLIDAKLISFARLKNLLQESNELTAIFVSSIKTAKKRIET